MDEWISGIIRLIALPVLSAQIQAMAKGKKSPKEIPLEDLRGVACFDTNEILLFVPAPVEEVAEAFKKLRKLKTWIKNATGKTVVVSEPSYVVYRLKGHKWTIIDSYRPYAKWPNEKDAKALSKTFNSRVIFYGNSDTGGVTSYDLFEKGKRLEHFMSFEELQFESKFRNVPPPEDGPEIYEFVDQFMEEQGAFAPDWTAEFDAFRHKPGAKIKLDVLPEIVERLDYLAG